MLKETKKNLNQNVIFHLMGNPAKNKAILPLDSRIKSENDKAGESGRSMVEMLGVLAIIGVLSVAGIAGYSIAMRSYRTNEIVNAASMLYIMAMAQNAGNGPTGKVAYTDIEKTNPSGVSSLEYENNTISITFNDKDDCTMAANKLGDKATADCDNKKITVNFGEAVAEPEITTRSECLAANRYWVDNQALIMEGTVEVAVGPDACVKTPEEGVAYCNQYKGYGFACNPDDPHDCAGG